MQQLIDDFRSAMAQRIQSATPRDLLTMASRLCDDEQRRGELLPDFDPEPPAPRILRPNYRLLDDDVVFDRSTGLYWTRSCVAGGARDWDASKQAAETVTFRGWKWRMPEVWERLSIVEYDRENPALNTDVFRKEEESSWEWTATQYKPFDGYFWVVAFYYGYAYGFHRDYHGCVRAVCAGQ